MQEIQQWVNEISKWKLKPLSKFEATCSSCNKKIIYEGLGPDETIAALKNAGWQLRDGGPTCTECQ